MPEYPAENFYEAVQSQWFTQMFSRIEQKTGTIISNGRMDQYLYPFYKKDLEEGKITPYEAQELMECADIDADVYIDTVSHEIVSIFAKRKLETKIGGASKTVSFRDEALERFLREALADLHFNGPIDVDLFEKNGQYYLSEINPRFGGAYLHAYGAGVDFIKLIENNVRGAANTQCFGKYEENVVMMMYDSVVIEKIEG